MAEGKRGRWWWYCALCVALLPAACTRTTTTPTVDIAPTETRAAELAQLATLTAPTATPVPTATLVPPTATATAEPPTATPTSPPAPPTPTAAPTGVSPPPPVVVGAPWAQNFSPYQIEGGFQRPEGRLYGRRAMTLYGDGSGYSQGVWTFTIEELPPGPLFLSFIGLDDERPEHSTLQVLVNDVSAFDGPNSFPNVPAGDDGEGGADRYWARMSIAIPPGALRLGTNTLTLRNASPWTGTLTSPYILINDLDFAAEQ